MQKYGGILLSLLILTAAAVGAYRWADALQYSVFTYRSPLSVAQIPPGEPMPPQTRRVVLVVVGGLTYETAYSAAMPNLSALLEAGASAPMLSRPPTYTPSAWTTLVTGVGPELNNAPLGAEDAARWRPLALDHLFAAARDAGLRTALAGSQDWERLLQPNTPDTGFYTPGDDALADAQVAQAALAFIADPQYNLILIHFGQLDAAGQAEGTDSAAYTAAARQIDNHLRQIIRLVDPSNSVLMVTSDHGRREDGRLGGDEPELTRLPFVMTGQKVIPGDYSPIRPVDVAPTVAALLGTRLPAAAEGRPLYPMLQLDPETLTQGQLQLAAQKVALGDAYLTAIGSGVLSQATHQDLAGARQAWLDGNQAGALQLAQLVTEEAMAEMASARAARIADERWPRLVTVVVGTTGSLLLTLRLLRLWGPPGIGWLLSVLGGMGAVVLYYGLYRLSGEPFSLSAVDSPTRFLTSLARYAAIGAGAGGVWVLIGLLYQDERRWSAAVATGYAYGVCTVYLSALPALVGYWQHGATVRWYLPDFTLTLVHFMALVQVTVVALLAIPSPWIIALVTWGIGRWRTRAEAQAQEWDPLARLRRR